MTARHATRVLLLTVVSSLLGSCAAPPVDVTAMVKEWANFMQSDYVLRPNDNITIDVHPADTVPTQSLSIPPTGSVSLAALPNPIEAVGRPVRAFRASVQEAYRRVFRDDVIVQVSLVEAAASSVFVLGAVNRGGPIPYTPNMTLAQVLGSTGGFAYRQKLHDVRVIRPLANGEPRTYRVNVEATISKKGAPDFFVLPGDVIYFQTVWMADVQDWMQLYIWGLLPNLGGGGLATAPFGF